MQHHRSHNAMIGNGMRDARTHVNRQKGHHGIEVPRTVAEQLDECVTEVDGRRRRDPLHAARAQHTHRDDAVGGAWLDLSQHAQADAARLGEQAYFEKLPNRHEQRFERRRPD